MRLSLVLAVVVALGVSGHAAAKVQNRHCGLTPRIRGQRFDVFIERGRARCGTVEPVITRYLRTSGFSPPWFCALGHSAQPWAASCGRGRTIVRAYAPG